MSWEYHKHEIQYWYIINYIYIHTLTGKALIRIFVSLFPFPIAPLMITAAKLPLVVTDYRRSTSSDGFKRHTQTFSFSGLQRWKTKQEHLVHWKRVKSFKRNLNIHVSKRHIYKRTIFIHDPNHRTFVTYDRIANLFHCWISEPIIFYCLMRHRNAESNCNTASAT